MFKTRHEAQWKSLYAAYEKYKVSNLKDGRVETLVMEARMDWDRGREARAIRKMKRAVDILQQNIVLGSEYSHIQDGISDSRGIDKVKKLEDRYNIQLAQGKMRQAKRTVRKLTRDSNVSSSVNNVTLETRFEDGYGLVAIIQNSLDRPITVREIKTRNTDGNERSIFAGLSTIDSRSTECYHLSSDASDVREIFVYYAIDTKSYTIVRRF